MKLNLYELRLRYVYLSNSDIHRTLCKLIEIAEAAKRVDEQKRLIQSDCSDDSLEFNKLLQKYTELANTLSKLLEDVENT